MTIQTATNYNLGMSMMNYVGTNSNSSSTAASLLANKTTQSQQLAEIMNSLDTSSGPGSVEVTSLPGLGYYKGQMTSIPSYTKDSVQNDYLTKSDSKTTEKEFEAAIKALAEKNAAAGIVENVGDDYYELAESYISAVSPDRKAIIDGASSTSLIPSKVNYTMANAYDDDGNLVASYNPAKGWSNSFTAEEKARNEKFDSLYWSAYNAYTKANNIEVDEDATKIENAITGQEESTPTTVDVSA